MVHGNRVTSGFPAGGTVESEVKNMKIEYFLSMLRPIKRGLEVHIKANAYRPSQFKEIVKMAADIQKEYSCYCTLDVNTDGCFNLSNGKSQQ